MRGMKKHAPITPDLSLFSATPYQDRPPSVQPTDSAPGRVRERIVDVEEDLLEKTCIFGDFVWIAAVVVRGRTKGSHNEGERETQR